MIFAFLLIISNCCVVINSSIHSNEGKFNFSLSLSTHEYFMATKLEMKFVVVSEKCVAVGETCERVKVLFVVAEWI
jgi:hypothetical protein